MTPTEYDEYKKLMEKFFDDHQYGYAYRTVYLLGEILRHICLNSKEPRT